MIEGVLGLQGYARREHVIRAVELAVGSTLETTQRLGWAAYRETCCARHRWVVEQAIGAEPRAAERALSRLPAIMQTLEKTIGSLFYATTDPVLRALVPSMQAAVEASAGTVAELKKRGTRKADAHVQVLVGHISELDRAWTAQDSAAVRRVLFELERHLQHLASQKEADNDG